MGQKNRTSEINILGVSITNDGIMEMRVVLRACSYNKDHNFNLLSMSMQLHKQGLKIKCGGELLIRIKNGKGGVVGSSKF
jgi:hypothetical protein